MSANSSDDALDIFLHAQNYAGELQEHKRRPLQVWCWKLQIRFNYRSRINLPTTIEQDSSKLPNHINIKCNNHYT